jgi:hypothetical protein
LSGLLSQVSLGRIIKTIKIGPLQIVVPWKC